MRDDQERNIMKHPIIWHKKYGKFLPVWQLSFYADGEMDVSVSMHGYTDVCDDDEIELFYHTGYQDTKGKDIYQGSKVHFTESWGKEDIEGIVVWGVANTYSSTWEKAETWIIEFTTERLKGKTATLYPYVEAGYHDIEVIGHVCDSRKE